MRLAIILSLIGTIGVFATATYSQETKITLNVKEATLSELLTELGKKYEFSFWYSSNVLDNDKKLTVNIKDMPIDKILEVALKEQDLIYTIKDKMIFIYNPSLQISDMRNEIISFQKLKITGLVRDAVTGEPIPGVNVILEGTSIGVISDINGLYSIEVPNTSSYLVFSFMGYNSERVLADGSQPTLNISLVPDIKNLDEVVVIGYGIQKKATLTGSQSTVKGDDLAITSSVNVSNSIAGRLSGVIANNRSGRPGNDDSQILIRGLNSFGGGTSPLIVIDGIPDRDMNRINPNDIESVTVLKDASAAIYGVRSANGVILITTKRGKSGKPTIHYDGSVGTQQLTRMDKRVGAWEYMTYYNELNINKGGTAPYTQADIDKYKAGNDPNYTSTDWIEAVFRKNAPQTNHSLSVNGGNEQVKYYFSGQYLKQTSNFRNSDEVFKELNIRSNIDVKVSKNINVYLDIAARKEDRQYPIWGINNILHETVSMYPFLPVYWSNGLPNACISSGRNPAILTSSLPGYDKITNLIVNPKLGFDLQIPYVVKGLSLSGYAAFDYNNRSQKKMQKPWDAFTYDRTTNTYNNQRNSTSITSITQDERLNNQNTYFLKLSFERQFDKHNINAFVGYEQTTSNYKQTLAYRRDLLSDAVDQIFTGSTVDQNATGAASQDGRESYLGRIAYNYSDKYLTDVSFRYNGSFNFPSGNRWGLFPSVSLGWRISEEDFFKENIKAVEQLKLRASWGMMGNDAIAQYLYVTRYQMITSPDQYTYFDSNYTLARALYLSASPNPNITWEKQDSRNIGFDVTLLSNRLSVSFDAFRFMRKDILAQRNASVPLYTGLSLPAENIGKSLNRGIDFSVNYNDRRSILKYNIGINFTYAKSKIIFRDESPNIPEWQKSTGFAIDSWLVYETNGIYHTQSEVDNSPHMSGAKPGDIWLLDRDGDNAITSKDMVRIPESATPKIVFGIPMGVEYKGIVLDLVWSGQTMAKQMILPQMQGSVVAPPVWLFNDRWTSDNPNAIYPKAFNSSDSRNSVYADFWLRDASFLRLKSAELSYTIPANTFARLGISKARLYVGGYNLFSIDKMKKYNMDPETNNVTGISYPLSRIYKVGLNIEL